MPDSTNLDEEPVSKEEAEAERETLLQRISDGLDVPLAVLSLLWVGLLVVELALMLPPGVSERVIQADYAIWFLFALVFLIEFVVAPNKLRYLRSNFLTALSVLLPFARVVRVLRLARILRSLSLVRITLTANRATAAAAEIFSRQRFNHVLAITAVVTLLGAAGAFFFERDVGTRGFESFDDALWWAATMVTTINVGVEPATLEGRIIGLLLRVFALAVFGYVAGSIASFLVGQRVAERQQRPSQAEVTAQLTREVERLRAAVERLENTRRDDPRS